MQRDAKPGLTLTLMESCRSCRHDGFTGSTFKAGEGDRTLDMQLGRLPLYH